MDNIDPRFERGGPRPSSKGHYIECEFTAKQWMPTDAEIAADDTDHWYVLVEPQGEEGPLANMILGLALRDDCGRNASRVARLLEESLLGLHVTVVRRPGAAHN